ncbi:GntR family transcriptional regulator [Pseudodesulfovibrio sp.]|uniref:GntR family transcriptional regulator n=1 Tax=Pseudodesulfovibrio sp. TaxID=2035812 RepID=UPI00262252E1|nr:GntR family transcriptional regulator [Pseudodesulfovibrio sp.]MDD3313417.1 GntR family transcriptional regulator [Pseudodesulfovibrio sp.]
MRTPRTGVSQAIAATLAREIITGRREPGSPLRQERIAAEFQSSHVPVREALLTLQSEGLAVYRPRRGAVVAPLCVEDVEDIMDMRVELEALALRLAARSGTINQAGAGAALDRAEGSSDIDVLVEANRDFHHALYAPCGRARLLAAIGELGLHSERYLRTVWRELGYQGKSDAGHREILARLRAGDAPGAEAALRTHIRDAGEELAAHLPRSAGTE